MIDKIFDACVELLVWLADKCGTTYKRINVYIFCVAVPAIILGQAGIIVRLLLR